MSSRSSDRGRCAGVLLFFFNDTATTEIYTLSLHDALPICWARKPDQGAKRQDNRGAEFGDRKSTRLNSSHLGISYAVFCLKTNKHWPTRGHRYPHVGRVLQVIDHSQ